MSLALEDENRRSEEDVMIFLFSIEGRVISYYVDPWDFLHREKGVDKMEDRIDDFCEISCKINII